MFAEGGRALVPVAFPLVKLRHAPGDFHPPLYLATLSASPTTIVALRTTQTTNQGFVSFAASPNNALERATVAPAISATTSGLIALPSVPPAEQVRPLRSLSGGSSTGFHSLTGRAASCSSSSRQSDESTGSGPDTNRNRYTCRRTHSGMVRDRRSTNTHGGPRTPLRPPASSTRMKRHVHSLGGHPGPRRFLVFDPGVCPARRSPALVR